MTKVAIWQLVGSSIRMVCWVDISLSDSTCMSLSLMHLPWVRCFFFWGGQFYWGTWTYALRRKQDHSNLFPTPDTFVWVPKKVLLVDLCIDLLHWGHMRISSAMACHFGESKCMWKFAELVNASTVPKICITQQHMRFWAKLRLVEEMNDVRWWMMTSGEVGQ